MYKGIDYSRGSANIDTKTGIHYGVISSALVPYFYDEAEPIYAPVACPKCGNDRLLDLSTYTDDSLFESDFAAWDCENSSYDNAEYGCEACEYLFSDDDIEVYPIGWKYEKDGYLVTQGAEDSDLFVIKSPWYTYAAFCSPCAPGACDLSAPLEGLSGLENRAYCLGVDWFENEIPYSIHKV